MTASALIAIDWGTTLARAWRFDADGVIRERRSAPLGLRRMHGSRFEAALLELLGPWRSDRAPRIACGMVGSRQGWIEAPYVECPASLVALADRLVRAPLHALAIVPGVATRDRAGVPDVMRGEETQLLGAIATDASPLLAVLPGTHSKWARVEHGRIVDFTTFMTGELYALLMDHSMLGRLSGHEPRRFVGAAFSRGVARGLDEGELAHDLFGARTLALTGALASEDVGDWLSGLLVGREIRAERAWASRAGVDASTVHVIGASALVERYTLALAGAAIFAQPAVADAAAHGMWRIARRAGMV